MTIRLTHICLHVESVNDCTRFYERYCGFTVIADKSKADKGSVYLAEPGHGGDLVLQIMGGGKNLNLSESDDRHFGFAVGTVGDVDAIAENARQDGCLIWKPDEYVAGAYMCTVKDPNGNFVEFSVGHPIPPNR